MSHVEFGLHIASATADPTAIIALGTSMTVAGTRCHVTAPMSPRDATTTPSSSALAISDFLSLGTSDCVMVTNMKPGKKIAMVESAAPAIHGVDSR